MNEQKKLEQMFRLGQISRRDFISGMAALGVTATVSPLMFSKAGHAATPKKGGVFRAGISSGSTDDSFDPRLMKDSGTYFPSWTMRNNLVEIDRNGRAIPELAESWEVSSDLTTWIFNLRKDVEFHNGKSFAAEDVIYSMNIHRGETASAAKSFLEPIKEIKADGKHRVIFTLDNGNIDFQYTLSDVHLPIAPAGTKDQEWNKCIGTGAYILKEFEPGVRMYAVRNPNYWKNGRGHFDAVEFIVIKDASSRTTALRTGQIDYMNNCDVKTANLLDKIKNLKVINVTSGLHHTMPMRVDKKPFGDNNVRLAMKYAIDREEIVKLALNGYGSPANDHPIGPNLRFHAQELEQRTYDPDKAKYYLKKSGYSSHTFELSTAEILQLAEAAILFKEQAAKAGINVTVHRKPSDGYWSDVWRVDPFCSAYWNSRPTEDILFTLTWAANGDWNDTNWKHKKFNKLLVAARKEKDEDKRREMYFEMQKICRDEGATTVYLFSDFIMAADKKVQHGEIASNFWDDNHRATEKWWFSS